MARTPRWRVVHDRSTNHCTWRGHNLERVLESAEAKQFFLALLAEHKAAHGIEIHSYCLMGSHPHVLCKAALGLEHFSAFWKVVNYRFARWYNHQHARRGQVVMERMVSPLVQDGRHQLEVMRYGDLNPVRAGMVSTPKDFPWSSYRHYALGEKNPLITDAPEYLALATTDVGRRLAYVHLFASKLPDDLSRRRPDLVQVAYVGDSAWIAALARSPVREPAAPS